MNVIVFVVLHYLDSEVTSKCIDCLLGLNCPVNSKRSIVIVDNGSENDSYDLLSSRYSNVTGVYLLQSQTNVGFSRGNNIGYRFAVDQLHADYVVALNNDLMIQQQDFIERVFQIYEHTHYAVLGPDIVSGRNGVHQNPAHYSSPSYEEITERINEYNLISRFYIPHLIIRAVKRRIRPLKHSIISNEERHFNDKPGYDIPAEDVVLHGSCMIFSRLFINVREYAFNPATFLYFEEDILAMECKKLGLLLYYDPSLKALHLEDVSTDAADDGFNRHQRELRKIRRMLESYRIYRDML